MAASSSARKHLAQHRAFVEAFDAWVETNKTGTEREKDQARFALVAARNRLGNIGRLETAARRAP